MLSRIAFILCLCIEADGTTEHHLRGNEVVVGGQFYRGVVRIRGRNDKINRIVISQTSKIRTCQMIHSGSFRGENPSVSVAVGINGGPFAETAVKVLANTAARTITHVVATGRARPTEAGGMAGDVGGGQTSGSGAHLQRGENHRIAPLALVTAATVELHAGIVGRFRVKAIKDAHNGIVRIRCRYYTIEIGRREIRQFRVLNPPCARPVVKVEPAQLHLTGAQRIDSEVGWLGTCGGGTILSKGCHNT